MSPTGPAIRVSNLELKAGDRTLLREASLNVDEGELCLLVGASGTGKSLTLALLAGLLDTGQGIEARGEVEVLGERPLEREGDAGIPGTSIVFQDFALLDDVNAEGNVLFGLDHGGDGAAAADRNARKQEAGRLLEEFGLPDRMLPARMSGGMKQRLALARAMAFNPKLLFYDEPTSGLDPAMSRQVAERIRSAHDSHQMTSVVVSHDLPSLIGIADRVILLDPQATAFREVKKGDVDSALTTLRDFRATDDPAMPAEGSWVVRHLQSFLESTGDFVIGGGRALVSLIPRYPSGRWGVRFLWHFLRLGCLGTAIPFLALAGFITGFITTFFMFDLLPLQGYTEPVLVEEFIGSLGYVLYRVVIPGITTLLYASRTGAAIAADIGNRVLTRQVDAFRSHGIPPGRYLLTGLTLSSLIGIPILFVIAYAMSRLASAGVFLATHPGHGPYAFNQEFHQLVGTWGPFPGGTPYVMGKLLVSALGTAAIAYHIGMRPKTSGSAVAAGVTSTIIRATVFVLVVHLIFAFFEF